MRSSTNFERASVALVLMCWSLVLLGPGSSPATAQMLGTNKNGEMFVVNTTTGAAHSICNTPAFGNMGATEIEFNNLTLRGIIQGQDGSYRHQEFNPVGCVSMSGQIVNNRTFNGMEWVGPQLYAAGILGPCDDAALFILNPVDGTTAFIGQTGIGRPLSGLAWDVMHSVMYGTTGCRSAGTSLLVTVNLATGVATVVGDTGKTIGGLEFGKDNILYAGGNNEDGGNFYRIDTSTAVATLIGPTGFDGVTGLAFADPPVPTEILTWGAIKARYGS